MLNSDSNPHTLTWPDSASFTYDAENRLITESGPVTMTLAYDPTGRLQQSVINAATINFLYDGDALVAEYNGAGTLVRRYVHGPEVDDPLVWFAGATMTSATAHYLIADRQGSIAAVANSSGAITANYTYDPYGVPGAWGNIGTAPRFRYTGQAVIPEAQLYDYKARFYDPTAGKFLQTDPVGAGAARQMTEAVIVNPYSPEEMAEALKTALTMPRPERIRRWKRLEEGVRTDNVACWRDGFVEALAAAKEPPLPLFPSTTSRLLREAVAIEAVPAPVALPVASGERRRRPPRRTAQRPPVRHPEG